MQRNSTTPVSFKGQLARNDPLQTECEIRYLQKNTAVAEKPRDIPFAKLLKVTQITRLIGNWRFVDAVMGRGRVPVSDNIDAKTLHKYLSK